MLPSHKDNNNNNNNSPLAFARLSHSSPRMSLVTLCGKFMSGTELRPPYVSSTSPTSRAMLMAEATPRKKFG